MVRQHIILLPMMNLFYLKKHDLPKYSELLQKLNLRK